MKFLKTSTVNVAYRAVPSIVISYVRELRKDLVRGYQRYFGEYADECAEGDMSASDEASVD
jgi:hypothetical protein